MTLGMILPSAVAPAFSPVQNIVLALENQIFQAFGLLGNSTWIII